MQGIITMKSSRIVIGCAVCSVLFSAGVLAKEYPVGGPVEHDGMKIASAYLLNIETSPMPQSMVMGKDVIHLETDVHATENNKWGSPKENGSLICLWIMWCRKRGTRSSLSSVSCYRCPQLMARIMPTV